MALINCPECNNEISDSLIVCNFCGYPLVENVADSQNETQSLNTPTPKSDVFLSKLSDAFSKDNLLKTITAILMLLVGGHYVYATFTNFSNIIELFIDDGRAYEIIACNFYILSDVLLVIGSISIAINIFTKRLQEQVKFCLIAIAISNLFLLFADITYSFGWGFYGRYIVEWILDLVIVALWVLNASSKFINKKNDLIRNKKNIVLCATPMIVVLHILLYGAWGFWVLVLLLLKYIALILYTVIDSESEGNYVCVPMTNATQQATNSTIEEFDSMNTNAQPSVTFPNGYNKIWVLIVLSICTFGIYTFIWIYHTVALYNEKHIGEQQSEAIQVVLCLFVPFYIIYWIYKYSKLTEEYTLGVGNTSNDLSIFALILSIFGLGLIAIALLQDQINKNLLLEYDITIPKSQPAPYTAAYENNTTARETQSETRAYTNQTTVKSDRISDTDIEYLKKLKELNDLGILSEEEYNVQKEKVLVNSQ